MQLVSLYVKTHNITGLKYFGKTINIDVSKYKGSGTYWGAHIKKHGYDVHTEIIFESDNQILLTDFALAFSKNHDIVNSKSWANLKEEDGANGGAGYKLTPEQKKNLSNSMIGVNLGKVHSEQSKLNMSIGSAKTIHKVTGENHYSANLGDNEHPNTGKKHTIKVKSKMSDKAKNRERIQCPHCAKIGQNSAMKRWHFDNCKEKDN